MGEHFLNHRDVYGPVLAQGMAVCQETGEVEKVTRALSRLFEEETHYHTERFKALLEPILMIIVSVATATVLLSIYLPLAKVIETMMR